mgnify:FL=1
MAILKKVIGFLVLVFLTAGIYVVLPEHVKIEVKDTSTIFSQWDGSKWVPSATEYVYLWDGSTKMKASSRSVTSTDYASVITLKRTSMWKDNITTVHSYMFDGSKSDVELVLIEEYLECFNCKGKIINFEYTKFGELVGLTRDIESPFAFGKNMKVSWQDGAYYAKVIQNKVANDKIEIKYKATKDYEIYNVRMFDPLPDVSPVTINTTFGLNSTAENITAFNGSSFDASVIVHDWRKTVGFNLVADGDMEAAGTASWSTFQNTPSKSTANPHSGTQALRLTYLASTTGIEYQTILTVGKTYKLTGWYRGDGTSIPAIDESTTGLCLGTSSTTWQYCNVIFVSGGANLRLKSDSLSAGHWVEFDDVKIELVQSDAVLNMPFDINGSVGNTSNIKDYSSFGYNATFGNNGSADILPPVWNPSCGAYTGSGGCYVFSHSTNLALSQGYMIDDAIASKINPARGTISVWIKSDYNHPQSEWIINSNTNGYTLISSYADAYTIYKGTGLSYYKTLPAITMGTWHHIVVSWWNNTNSNNLTAKVYQDGVAGGGASNGMFNFTGSGIGTAFLISASATNGLEGLNGSIDDLRIYNRTLSDNEVAMMYSRGVNDRVHSDATE